MTHYTERVGNYQLVNLLGEGGMGEVFLAFNPPSNTPVAIKLMKLVDSGLYEELKQRFTNEALFVQDVIHPSIMKIERAGETHDYRYNRNVLYIACEYVPGGSLADYIYKQSDQGFLLKLDETLGLVAQVAEALGYAFTTKKLIHRDIKPANILLKKSDDGVAVPAVRAVVADFGVAKLMDVQSRTVTGTKLGSPPYASPEQAQGKKDLDARSDIYSLGILLYELLTGQRPFPIKNWIQAVNFHLKSEPIPLKPSLVVPNLPASVEAILLHALSKEPAQRFQSGFEMAEALRQAKQNLTLEEITLFATPKFQSFSLLPLVEEAYEKFHAQVFSRVTAQETPSVKVEESPLPQAAAAPPPVASVVVQQPIKKSVVNIPTSNPPIALRMALVVLIVLLCISLAGAFLAKPLMTVLKGEGTSVAIVTTPTSEELEIVPDESTATEIAQTVTPTQLSIVVETTETLVSATPTLAATFTPIVFLGEITDSSISVYEGPGILYPRLTITLGSDDLVTIVGVSSNKRWFKIELSGQTEAWVEVSTVQLINNEALDRIPIATSSVLPFTLTPTLTSTPVIISPPTEEDTATATLIPVSSALPGSTVTIRPILTNTPMIGLTPIEPSETIKPKSTETPCPGFGCLPSEEK